MDLNNENHSLNMLILKINKKASEIHSLFINSYINIHPVHNHKKNSNNDALTLQL